VQFAQLALELFGRGGVEEAEGDAALLAVDGVVHAVGLVQALEITPARDQTPGPAFVDQAVVDDEVEKRLSIPGDEHPGCRTR
jgi:hypothetical protein